MGVNTCLPESYSRKYLFKKLMVFQQVKIFFQLEAFGIRFANLILPNYSARKITIPDVDKTNLFFEI
jgi:hypothetical protein